MPRDSLDAYENLPKEAPCQATLRRLKGELSGVPEEAPTPATPRLDGSNHSLIV